MCNSNWNGYTRGIANVCNKVSLFIIRIDKTIFVHYYSNRCGSPWITCFVACINNIFYVDERITANICNVIRNGYRHVVIAFIKYMTTDACDRIGNGYDSLVANVCHELSFFGIGINKTIFINYCTYTFCPPWISCCTARIYYFFYIEERLGTNACNAIGNNY